MESVSQSERSESRNTEHVLRTKTRVYPYVGSRTKRVFSEAEMLLQFISTQAMPVPRIQNTACSSPPRSLERVLRLHIVQPTACTHADTYPHVIYRVSQEERA